MTKYFLMTLALGTAVGCGGGGDTLTEQQTMQALTAVVSGVGAGTTAASGQIQGSQGQVTVNASAACLNGGSVAVNGRASANTTTQEFSYDLSVGFATCRVANITMDGGIDVAGDGSFDPARFSFNLDGRVTFSGDLSGTCVFDLTQSYDEATGRFTYRGRACGNSLNIEINTGG